MSITVNLQHPTGFRARDFTKGASGFVTVEVTTSAGTVDIFLDAAAQCDEGIKAFAEAKRLLSPPAAAGDFHPSRWTGPAATAAVGPEWCPAVTEVSDATVYCDRENGHDGSHHAPGPDEGSEVAWSDEPEPEQRAAITLAIATAKREVFDGPICAAESPDDEHFRCTRPPGHTSLHVALGSETRDEEPVTWPQEPAATAVPAQAIADETADSGEDGERCSPGCGYYNSGQDLLEHRKYEHATCTECSSEPRHPDAVMHKPYCPRLKPGYSYPAQPEASRP